MTTVAVVAATYLAGKLIYRLRDILLLIIVAGFVALLLNPVVNLLQQRVSRAGASPSPSSPSWPRWSSSAWPWHSGIRW